jgi:hypothetical protein
MTAIEAPQSAISSVAATAGRTIGVGRSALVGEA